MLDSHLTLIDYQHLLQFSQRINSQSESYLDGILRAIRDFFGWNLTMYYVLDPTDAFSKPILRVVGSHSLSSRIIEQFKRIYNEDAILHKSIQRYCISNECDGIYYTQDMISLDDFMKTGYYTVFSQYGMQNAAVLLLDGNPELRINIYKTDSEGLFNAHEKELLLRIREVILVAVKQQMDRLDYDKILQADNELFDSQKIGRLIIDPYFSTFKCNEYFTRMATKICKSNTSQEVINEFIEIVEGCLKQRFFELRGDTSLEYEGMCITICQRLSKRWDLNRWQYYIFTIRSIADSNDVSTYSKANKNELTSREKQVLMLLSEGYSNKEISGKLSISAHTVKAHVTNLFIKLNVNNRTSAAVFGKDKTIK